MFEHSLTTDLLNHLVFVQKVFMKEVNEVVQKVYGGEKPVPLWLEDDESTTSTLKRILFSLIIRIKVRNRLRDLSYIYFALLEMHKSTSVNARCR